VSEQDLISRAREGDSRAQRALYDAHVARVYRLAFRMTGNDDLAQDLTQDTFIRAFTRLNDFRGDSAFSTWLHAIGVSVVLNGLRTVKRFRQREAPLEEADYVSAKATRTEPDVRYRLNKAIEALPDGYRMVFVMHDIEGFTHEEIGAALGVKEGTSKAQLFRARAKLREALADLKAEWA
jgi:RNA polymerase sigma-70 factor (ECF subfamily)